MMPYHYLEDIAVADVAFLAWGRTLEEMFVAAAKATMNVMVEDLASIDTQRQIALHVESDTLDMLLFRFLSELIFLKDAESILLSVVQVHVEQQPECYRLTAEAQCEELNRKKHQLKVDVKAVTLHRLRVEQKPHCWECSVVLDV